MDQPKDLEVGSLRLFEEIRSVTMVCESQSCFPYLASQLLEAVLALALLLGSFLGRWR